MDDATLNPGPDESQGPGDDVGRIVEQLTGFLGPPGGNPVPLEGGITNRNYRATFDGVDYVIRVPGKDTNLLGIDREAERVANERAARIGIAPPVRAMLADPPCIVTLFVEGAGMSSAQLREPEAMVQVARSLRAMHELGESLENTFDSFRIVEEYAELAGERGAMIPGEYWVAHDWAKRIEAAIGGPEHDPVPCHNDLLAANFIRGESQLWIVDWEYAGMGDRYFDLANFSINNELDEAQQLRLLADYFGAPDPADAVPGRPEGRLAALRLFMYMSDFREAMWGVLQGTVSELDFDFRGYARDHFARLERIAAEPRFATWIEDAGA